MSVTLIRRSPGATSSDLERVIGPSIGAQHSDWVDFLLQQDGAVPDVNEFDVGADNGSGVQTFYGAEEAVRTREHLSDRLPAYLLPIADAEGGNFVCLGLSPQVSGVFFWDHETERAIHLAASFTGFVEALRPFDPDSVELKPGQVVSAWIDPALLEAESNK